MSGKLPIDSLWSTAILVTSYKIRKAFEPERWKLSLVQGKYRKERACDKRQQRRRRHNNNNNNNNNNNLFINFMQDIYNNIPETNHVSTVCNVAAILYLQWNVFSSVKYILYFHISTPQYECSAPVWLFFVVPHLRIFLVRCSGIVWVILKRFQSPLLLPVSLLLSHSTCAEFLLWGPCILKSSQLLFDHIALSIYCNIY